MTASAVDGAGNIYVAGTVDNGGEIDLKVVKYSSSGMQLAESNIATQGQSETVYNISVEPSGNVYVVGSVKSAGAPLPNGVSTQAFVAKFSTNLASDQSLSVGNPYLFIADDSQNGTAANAIHYLFEEGNFIYLVGSVATSPANNVVIVQKRSSSNGSLISFVIGWTCSCR